MKILIVEDTPELSADIVAYLESGGYSCELAENLADAELKCASHNYDCIVLDLMLPDGTGLQLLRSLKSEHREEGVIILSAKNSLDDKIEGLKIGADDYLEKPFHHAELAARIFSVIRRKKFQASNIIQHGKLRIDLQSAGVDYDGNVIGLTKKELSLLQLFIGNVNKVISRSTIAEYLSGDFADMLDNHDFVYAHIKNLKKKLKEGGAPDCLKTVYGIGYKWQNSGNY